MNVLERHHLIIVREVERQGSLTAAARQLHLTQSALSHAIAKLEQSLGTELWRQEGRTLRLTQPGQYLLEVANRLLPQMEHAEVMLREHASGTRGSLRIGMECHPCHQWLLKVVARYMPAWPQVDVDVKQRFRFGGIQALLDHEIDVVVTPDPEHREGLSFVPVFDYEQVLVVGSRHPFASLRHVRPEQLAGEVLITYPVETGRLDIYNLFLTPAGVVPQARKTIESTDLILQMVASGRGVAALPRWLVEEQPAALGLKPVRLGKAGVPKQIHLGVRKADLETGFLRAFIEAGRSLP